ncbi:hypothetical protein [Reyranella sp.]|uniref:hypothetical protein n=1 Tax=Reyranella sp. TaxID=1929291 RepID=UPI003D135779
MHAAKADAARLFTLFRSWLRRQCAALGREVDADTSALHVLMRPLPAGAPSAEVPAHYVLGAGTMAFCIDVVEKTV